MNEEIRPSGNRLSSSHEPAQVDFHAAWIESARQEAEGAVDLGSSRGGFTVVDAVVNIGDMLTHCLPGYEIGREISRGGQGVVYRSRQSATRRDVAIKVMREGPFAGTQDRARFEREVQILGALNHPNIVTILDSGSSAGHFYFIMDYIQGLALDNYFERHGLSVRETLELFAKICAAINVAHLRGVIHRDLKPGNIRVDRAGEPHVMDFGLAKVHEFDAIMDAPGKVKTVTGQFVGSPPWASPEQVDGRPEGIDVRTDVYSIGIMLYQTLTGEFPYQVVGSTREVLDNICHAEPPKLSSINRNIDDEVDQIVLKCLRKDRETRYETGGDLAREIRRYLAGEPIEAKRDSTAYVVRKYLKRHKLTLAIGAGFTMVVIGAFVVALTLWRQAVAASDAAQAEADKARAVNRFMQDDLLGAMDPAKMGIEVAVREVLDKASEKIGERFTNQPAVEAEIRELVGDRYMELGDWKTALPHAERSLALRRAHLGNEHPETLSSMIAVARLYRRFGRFDEAEALFIEMLDLANRLLGEEHELTLKGMNNYAYVLSELGRSREAYDLNGKVLEINRRILGPEDEATLRSLNNHGFYTSMLDRNEEAAELYAEAYETRKRVLGEEHPKTLISMSNLARQWYVLGRLEDAEKVQLERLRLVRRVQGARHPQVPNSLNILGDIYRKLGRFEESERMFTESLDIQLELTGEDHYLTAGVLSGLGKLYRDQNRNEEAEENLARALAINRRTLGDKHRQTYFMMSLLGNFYVKVGRYDEAEKLLLDAYAGQVETIGAEHREATDTAEDLVELYEAQGLSRRAERWRAKLEPLPPDADVGAD